MENDFRTYLFRYSHAGANWGLEIKAASPEDAEQRIRRLAFATYQGEIIAKVPVIASTPARVVVTARNTLHRIKDFLTR
jgi:hypothetical protein